MNRYEIRMTFSDGDELHARAVGETAGDAVKRVCETQEAIDYMAGREPVSTEVTDMGEFVPVSGDPGRFDLQPSSERDGWWVATDKDNGLVIRFAEGDFNGTAKATPLEDMDAIMAASSMRELADWLAIYHRDLL